MKRTQNYEEAIVRECDSYCKKVLRNHARNIYKKGKHTQRKVVSLEALPQTEWNQLQATDTYDSNYIYIRVFDHDVYIKDTHIAEAIESLSTKRKNIILLTFFVEMTIKEVALLMEMPQSNVHYHKKRAQEEIRKFLERDANEN